MVTTTTKLTWYRYIPMELGLILQHAILKCDNQSVLKLVFKPIFHVRNKHIELNYHLICEKVERWNRSKVCNLN